jgi:diguanylate cyclase (GGDEF)-like protein
VQEDCRILLVESNPSSSARLRNWLQEQKYRVFSAATGREALRKIREEMPDLVLLNPSTADPDEIDVARRLRRNQRYADLPIILLAPRGEGGTHTEGLEADVDDFILRPLRLDEVGVRIRTMLKRREAVRGLQRANLRLKEANWKLKQILIYDAKTELYNFRYFTERIEEEFKRADRYNNYLSCIMLDLDRFKRVNDRHGHPEGDKVLKGFAAILTETARETDFVARYGGEEFAVILPQTNGYSARILAERVRRATEAASFQLTRGRIRMTVSAGIATFPSNPAIHKAADLVKHADDALYRAKQQGRNRACLDKASEKRGPLPEPEPAQLLRRRKVVATRSD